MGKIAISKSPYRLALYRQVLAASAAVPGAFPPVYIRQGNAQPTLHVDGGVRNAMLFRSYMIDVKGTNQRVWAIVNSHITYKSGDMATGANVESVVSRSISEMLRSILLRSVQRIYTMTRVANAEFRLAYIPDDVVETDPMMFKPDEMKRLFEAGYAFGRKGKWASEPPRLEKLERVP
jgi:predicted acylesterase/phospholipase RssA